MADTYYNEFFEGYPKLSKADLKIWLKENDRRKKVFAEHPTVNNLTRRDIWQDRAKFYFLPFFINCYKFTRQHQLPHFAIPVSPTCMFYRDRLHLRNFMDTVWSAFFACLDMCVPKSEPIMLLVEKRFYVEHPIDGGTQQLYNMLWDYDLSPAVHKVKLPPPGSFQSRLAAPESDTSFSTSWDWEDLNPDVPIAGIELARRTVWLQDDLFYICRKYYMESEEPYPEILDLTKYPEDKRDIYAKTARTFHFITFMPKDIEDEEEVVSSDSDLDDLDDDDFDIDSTQMGLLDSTLDFEEEEDKMKKIIAFFANLPKVAGLVQGMVDMMGSLTRILPLVADKIEDPKLKAALERTINIVELGLDKVLKICAFLGMKVKRGESKAIGHIVKNRFKKHDKKDLLEFEVDELNKYLDALEKIDEIPPKPIHGQIPLDVKPNHLYPQKMPLRGRGLKREDLRLVVPPQPPIPVPEGQKIEGQVPPDPIPPPPMPPTPDDKPDGAENNQENVNTNVENNSSEDKET